MIRSKKLIATPPGATIKEQLSERQMSQKEFAARMNMSEKHISQLINGEVALTPETAIKLEMVLGVPAKFWNNLEEIYRDRMLRIEAENTLQEDAQIAKKFPYKEMADLEWVPVTNTINDKVTNLRKFFGVVSLSLITKERITRIACRRLAVTEKSDLAFMAWAQEARIEARNIPTESINTKKLISSVPKLREMTMQDPEVFSSRMKKMLAECGIALVFLPHLNGSFLHGATFIDGKKIVIGLTARGRDADKFWFSLFHEFAHIVLGDLDTDSPITNAEEKKADKWAEDALIDKEEYQRYVSEHDFSEKSVLHFAQEIGIAPGIVVGRLQREGLIKYSWLNELKTEYEIG